MKLLDAIILCIFVFRHLVQINCNLQETESGRTLIVVKKQFKCPKGNFNLTRLGQEVTVFSPNYPFSYPNNINCRFLNLCGHYLLKSISVAHKLVLGIRSGPFNFLSILYPNKKFKCSVKVVRAAVTVNGTVIPGEEGMMPLKPSCGIAKSSSAKVAGGDMVDIGAFPWRCLLQVRMGSTVKKSCTCSIISNQWILSSAHCTLMEDIKNVFIYVGGNSYGAAEAENGLPVAEIMQNSKYGGKQNNDDTSLIRLGQPLEFNESVSPVCLPCKFKGQQFLESQLSVSGFVEMDGTYTLLHKDLMTLERFACMVLLPINSDEICLYEKGKEECDEMGETGSYADYLDPETGLYYAAGIHSWSGFCMTEKKPSVHQNVARYLDWIEMITGQKFC
ncbi:unnamed protein product [Allacma fusca]|uniref:Peptidase S1 domain-containing protein n=1 Tax=Allacma fusca TaxID=39272 RepID=A0A8J2P3K5_9HEXA|nr:unnamed protein product [Allacma fusca]